jgi:hypothetical protein
VVDFVIYETFLLRRLESVSSPEQQRLAFIEDKKGKGSVINPKICFYYLAGFLLNVVTVVL